MATIISKEGIVATVVEPFEGRWSSTLPFEQEEPFVGGDCGSGVYDVNGNLVAIASH